ncbi:MAG: hypothetical protein KFF73_10290, partial [Cyclobacteriaceae bacterium]|nr:hypothetical protein [Cyclobacteriaceae bacterium]
LTSILKMLVYFSYTILIGCQGENPGNHSEFMDPRTIINQGGLSHGLGYGPLDSGLLQDSLNAAILIEMRKGIKLQELQKQFPEITGLSQRIDSLKNAGIIVFCGQKFFPVFPLIIGEERESYFNILSGDVDRIYDELLPDIKQLAGMAKEKGWEAWTYHIVWSLVFDSQFVWYKMVDREMVPPLTELMTWVIYPPHPYKTGTNYYPNEEFRDFWIVVSWSPYDNGMPGEIGSEWNIVYNAALQPDELTGPDKAWLKEMGLMNQDQEILFPAIHEDDQFFNHLQEMAGSYLDKLRNVSIEPYQEITTQNSKYTWCIIYHDISWEIMKRLEEDYVVNRPGALSERDSGTATGINSVIPVYQPFIDQIFEALDQ